MATINRQDVIAIAPELSSVDSNLMNVLVEHIGPRVSDAAWGTEAKYAACLLVAHAATLSLRGDRGALTSETVGEISRTYGAIGGNKSLRQTSYGVQYEELLRGLSVGPMVV